MAKCMHFEVGTWIMQNNRRGEIMDRYNAFEGTLLTVCWEDGSVGTIKPHALNRR